MRHLERQRIRLGAVFMRALQSFGLRGVLVGDIVYFVSGMQPLHHLQGADLASAIGWMQEARADPKDSHAALFTQRSSCDLNAAGRYLHEAVVELSAAASEEHVAPDLQI